MKTVALFSRHGLADVRPTIEQVVRILKHRGLVILGDEVTRGSAPSDVAIRELSAGARVDAAVVLGGDGTLLRAIHVLGDTDAPVLGVNFGSLGFLTEITVAEIDRAVLSLIDGSCASSLRRLLRAAVRKSGTAVEESSDGLNDATLTKATTSARILEFSVSVDGSFVSKFRADGIIVATPTGSTAYNLAAGGPIVHPGLDALVLTPICPHMLANRPLVVPGSARIEISFEAPDGPVDVNVDGQWSRAISGSGSVLVSSSTRRLRLVTSAERDYFELLRAKLGWGGA